MKNRPTLVLLALAAAAIAYFFFVEQPRHAQRVASDDDALRLTAVVPSEVARVVIERPDVTLRFVRSEDGWLMNHPVADLAEDANVNVLIHAITGAEVERRFHAEDSVVANFGLEQPEAAVRLLDGEGEPLVEIDVGSLTMTSEFAYARFPSGGDVLLVPTGIRRYALREVFEFRSKIVADFEANDVTRFELTTLRGTLPWWKTEGEWYTDQAGDTLRGDEEAITTVLRRLLAIRARGFVDNSADSTAHFDAPSGSISVALDDSPVRFTFSPADSQQCYVATSIAPRVALVNANILDVFLLGIEDLRDRHVARFDHGTLAKITLETERLSLSIIKRVDEWTFTNPGFGSVDQTGVTVLIKELQGLKYRDVINEQLRDPENWGLDPPAYRLALLDARDRILDEILAGPMQAQGRIRYATSRSSGHLGTVDTEPLDEIEALFEDFRTP